MSDVFTKTKRSAVMSRIRGTGNKDTELRLIVLMRAAGITGWRRSVKLRFAARDQRSTVSGQKAQPAPVWISADQRRLAFPSAAARRQAAALQVTIKPDFVFRIQRLAVFVDGCFWHGCPKHATWPRNNAEFWRAKIEGNISRDRLQDRLLRKHGWRVLRIWEHALTPGNVVRTLARLRRTLSSQAPLIDQSGISSGMACRPKRR